MADYFTTDELRDLPDMGNEDRFPDSRLEAARDWITSLIERECGTSFVETTVTDERLTGSGTDGLRLLNPYVRTVTAVTVDGTSYTQDQIDALLVEDGFLYAADFTTWPATSRGNVLVSYTAGYSTTPPADLKEAAMRGARNWLLTSDAWSGVDARATSLTNDFGNVQISTPGEGRPTGIPDVDATIMAWARRVRVPGVA